MIIPNIWEHKNGNQTTNQVWSILQRKCFLEKKKQNNNQP